MPAAPPAARYDLTRWVYLRCLGLVYAVAFWSLWVQIDGLVGSGGILPAERYLELARRQLGTDAWWRLPTLCWVVGASDRALDALSATGLSAALLLVLGVAPGPMLLVLWVTYLSLAVVSQIFLNFQWDALLLETGLLSIAFAPWRRRPAATGAWLPLWCLRLLLFKLTFMSGMVKVAGGDPTWRDLTALQYHYWTTCLPVWVGWYVHHLPAWVHTGSVLGMYFIELVVPFGIFGPRPARLAACAALVLLQVLIGATGNYGFFNFLTVTLCVTLLDDQALRRIVPTGLEARVTGAAEAPPRARWMRGPAVALALLYLSVSLSVMAARFLGPERVPAVALDLIRLVAPLRSVNGYGLFARMTTTRPEIVVEGSSDGRTWLMYEFRWKPGDPARRPAFAQPHMPRLDWQMWFAALGSFQGTPWFLPFLRRLQEGAPAVLALLDRNPFPGDPPPFVRAVLYDYRFADPETRARDGTWWRRELRGLWAPVIGPRSPGGS